MATNKEILLQANDHIRKGDHEGFLSLCTEDVVWNFIGDQILYGKAAVREYMATSYAEPPEFIVEDLISEDNHVIALGRISLKDRNGKTVEYDYCDVWKFREGRMAVLKAFVSEIKQPVFS